MAGITDRMVKGHQCAAVIFVSVEHQTYCTLGPILLLRKNWKFLFVGCMQFILMTTPVEGQRTLPITTREGLNTLNVTQLLRDRRNNMWIASYNGLHKHEGSSIVVYNRSGIGDASLSSGENHTVFEDQSGNIWTGGPAGVDCLDPVSGKITNYPIRVGEAAISSYGYVYAIFEDQKQRIWISTDLALFRLDRSTGFWEQIPETKDAHGVPSSITGYVTGVGDDQGFWIQVPTGLVFYEYEREIFFHLYHNPDNNPVFNLPQPSIGANGGLYLDEKENLFFIAQHRYLLRYNLKSKALDTVHVPFPEEAWKCCVSLTVDRKGRVWVGTRKGGILIYSPMTRSWESLRYNDQQRLISSDYIQSLCEDYQGRMWVAGDQGIDIIDYDNTAVQSQVVYAHEKDDLSSIDPGILSFNGRDQLYIPYFNAGMVVHSTQTHTSTFIPLPQNMDRITYVHPITDDLLWVADSRGLVEGRIRDQSLQAQPLDQPFDKLLRQSRGSVIWLFKNHDHSIFFKKNTGFIYHYTGTDTLEIIQSTGFMKQACVSPDRQSFWYLLPDLNLARRDLTTHQTDTFDLLRHLASTTFSYSSCRDLLDDGQGHLWISSINGILRYDYHRDSLSLFTQSEGLTHGFNYAFALDSADRLWTSNLGGIDVFEPQARQFQPILSSRSNRYVDAFGSALRIQDNRLAFISGQTLSIIDPTAAVHTNHHPLAFLWQEIRVNERPVDFLHRTKPLRLRHDQNRLYFRFGVLEFDQPQKIKYAYRLLPEESEWIALGHRYELLLQALPPGDYQLQLRAEDPFGQVPDQHASFAFLIRPPFYATWWFRLKIAALLLLAGMLYMQSRIQAVKRKNQIRQQLQELEARALRAQMNPHFIFNCLNAIQECIVTEKIDLAYTYLAQFSKLLRRILNSSDQNFIPLRDEIETLHLYLSLESMRFSQSFQYTITVDPSLDTDEIRIPSMLLQPYVENAIWHGLIHKEGDKLLTLSFARKDDKLICQVRDNGIGRQKAGEIKNRKMGSGLFQSRGSELTRQRIDLLLRVYPDIRGVAFEDHISDTGTAEGTSVTITLPLHIESR